MHDPMHDTPLTVDDLATHIAEAMAKNASSATLLRASNTLTRHQRDDLQKDLAKWSVALPPHQRDALLEIFAYWLAKSMTRSKLRVYRRRATVSPSARPTSRSHGAPRDRRAPHAHG